MDCKRSRLLPSKRCHLRRPADGDSAHQNPEQSMVCKDNVVIRVHSSQGDLLASVPGLDRKY